MFDHDDNSDEVTSPVDSFSTITKKPVLKSARKSHVSVKVPSYYEDTDSSSDEDTTNLPSNQSTTHVPSPFPSSSTHDTTPVLMNSSDYSPTPTRIEVTPFSPGPAFSPNSPSRNPLEVSHQEIAPVLPEVFLQENNNSVIQPEEDIDDHAHKEAWFTPKGPLSPRDRRALRSSAKKNHSSKLPDGSFIFRGKRLMKKRCTLCD